MTREIPAEAQVGTKAFLEEEKARKSQKTGRSKKDINAAQSLKSRKLPNPEEALALARSMGAEIKFGGDHYHIKYDGKTMPLAFRTQQQTIDPGTWNDLKKFLKIKKTP